MEFSKLHGLGNDYIYLNCMEGMPGDMEGLARRLSDRHFGVGGDGVICVCPSGRGDFRMQMFNADGSEGEMCGNGIRGLGKFVFDRGLTDKQRLVIETEAGLRTLALHLEGGTVAGATVDMGAPEVGGPCTVEAWGRVYRGLPVSMGNPHCVVEVEEVERLNLPRLGPVFEHHPAFPQRTNTEFVRVLDTRTLQMRVWERGSGETMACGTGACAAVAAMVREGRLERRVQVRLAGGSLEVAWRGDGHIYLTGPVQWVFDGTTAVPRRGSGRALGGGAE